MGFKLPGRRKYGNTRTTVDGVSFDSKREGKRFTELKVLLHCGEITDLRLQVRYPCAVNGVEVCVYVADFVYRDVKTGETVVEDVKGFKTKEYPLKRKLVLAVHGITIRET